MGKIPFQFRIAARLPRSPKQWLFRAIAGAGIPWIAIGAPMNVWASQLILVPVKSSGRQIASHQQRKLLVEPHDTLSQALDRQFPDRTWRIWGKNGMVAKIAAANPDIEDINMLYPGTILDLGPLGSGWEVVVTQDAKKNTRAPAAAPETMDHGDALPKSKRFGWISLSPSFSFSRINSTDNATGGSATLLSELSPGVSLTWGQHWSEHLETSLDVGFEAQNYSFGNTSPTLNNPSHTFTQWGLAATYTPAPGGDLAFTLGAHLEQEPYFHASSTTTDVLDAVTVPKLSAGVNYKLGELWPFALSVHGEFNEYLQGTGPGYTVQTGQGYDAGVRANQAISQSVGLSGDVWYSYASQNSTISTETRQEIGVTFGLTFTFSPPPKPADRRDEKTP